MRLIITAAVALLATPAVAQVPTPGTVTIEPPAEAAASPAARTAFAEAAARALGDAGFLALPGQGGARYVARLTLTRTPKGAVATVPRGDKPGFAVGDWGVGAIMALPSRKTQVRALIITRLTIAIARPGVAEPVWTGSALTAQAEATPADAPDVVAAKLAGAVMRGFPGSRGQTVSVP